MTIAVLPFANMSSSKENEYFSDGITEEIINALAKIPNLKVTSRTSSFFFKNKSINIKDIAKTLGVSTILEGSIRLSNDTVRITAQLIQAEEDFHFWSETWDRKLDNIFEIQDEISLIIADKLREEFGHLEIQEHLVDKQTENIKTYEYSLKANYLRNKWNPEDVKKAILLYKKALELDPKHSESHLGLADCYSFLGTTGFLPFPEAWEKTHQYTQQALNLNPNLSGVHYQLANQAFFIECDYNKSLQEMKKAIKINPNNAEAQQFMSFLYIIAGERTKSKKHLDIAKALNPLSEETQFFNAYYHYMIGDFEKAAVLLDKCIKANDKNIPAYSVKALCLLKLGLYDEVINYYDQVPSEVIVLGEKTGAIALAYALKNEEGKTQEYQHLLEEQAKGINGFTADSFLFMLYVVLGNLNKAFDWIDDAIKNKSSLLLLRFADPLLVAHKDDPRYLAYKNIIFKVENSPRAGSAKRALLDPDTSERYRELVNDYIKEHQPYLDSSLSLRSFAKQIKIHPNQLSWLLNENFGKNFNEYINHYRIETFKSLAKNPQNSNITIMGLAYDSGFNSKTVFNTYFKKETGLTPKQFINQ
ncbi:helix-turn-helix domain-containing protein [Lentimicrobium sp. L6]|uniref:tetratricopeptide repeat protein n=1 Tax=Lentimicrobium sp. L6 TaxID=2735916 RepID=UPI00155533CB|nr:tetratricopeptide repeat protein [Lentimicrobium sp. L6]NPD86789.1 helix-turn-helix domain-containing protein [Lentimicrobium sp. L6]